MKLKYLTLFIFIFALIISACTTQVQPKQTVCNKPYILVGNNCCLDKDDNSICDSDESKEEVVKEVKSTCNKPYIQVGAECCLDQNDNKICDKDETTQKETTIDVKGGKSEYSITDIQADINKVVRGDIFKYTILAKSDSSTEDFDFYTDNVKTTTFLAKRSSNKFFKVLEKFGITVIDIKDQKNYFKDKKDFVNIIKDNIQRLTSYENQRKEEVIQEAKDGEIHRLLEEKQSSNIKLIFRNISVTDDVVYDEITHLSTVSDKIVEILKVSFENYDLWYNKSQGKPIKYDLLGLSYLQVYSIFCSPNLVITIYANRYEGVMDENNIKNHVQNHRSEMLREAQAIISMCEERYEFTYLRSR